MIGEGVYLRTYLAPFSPWLDRTDVTDILVNRPGEVWIDGARGFEHHAAPDVTEVMMLRLAQQIAALDAASYKTPTYPYWHQRDFAARNPKPTRW